MREFVVVDDDSDFLIYMQNMLRSFKIEARSFDSPRDFLDSVRGAPPDIVFLDMMMTERDGIQVIESLAQDHFNAPIVLMSASEPSVLSAAARFAEMSGLKVAGTLRKPFWRGELGNILEHVRDDAESHSPLEEGAIRRSLDQGMLTVHYQPVVDHASQQLLSFEALVRLRTPSGRLVQPSRFMGTVEDAHLGTGLTRRVLEKVVADLAEFKLEGHRPRISINIDVDALLDDQLPQFVSDQCAKAGVETRSLSLELDAGEALGTGARAVLKGATRFRLLGIGLCIDGVGARDFDEDNLRALPVTSIKICGDTVRSMRRDSRALLRVKAITEVASALGVRVSAKGVETRELRQSLLGIGCTGMQGFLIGKPMPRSEIGDWMATWKSDKIEQPSATW